MLEGRGTRHGQPEDRDRAVVDVYFYTVGNMLGVDRINKWATLFGLGVRSNIDLPNELVGLVPSTEWKKTQKEKSEYAGDHLQCRSVQGRWR